MTCLLEYEELFRHLDIIFVHIGYLPGPLTLYLIIVQLPNQKINIVQY